MIAAIVGSVVLGAGAGAATFLFGGKFQGKMENSAAAGFAVFCICFAILNAILGSPQPVEGGKKKKKKAKKSAKSTSAAKPAPAVKKAAKPAAAAPAKKEKTEVKKAKKTKAAPTGKASGGKASGKADKAPKKKGSKAGAKKQKAPEPEEEPIDSDDEFSLENLRRGKTPAVRSTPAAFRPDDSDEDLDLGSEKKDSKSSIRRRKQKEKKEAAAYFEGTSKPVVDDDGFETVMAKPRRRKPKAAAVEGYNGENLSGNEKSEEFVVEQRLFGVIIGPGGKTLNAHQDACNVRINVPDQESEKRTITLVGTQENINECKRHLNQLISKGYSSITDPEMTSATLAVGEKMGFVIGPKGVTIKTLQEKCNVRVKTADGKVVISGLKADVESCRTAIRDLLTEGFSSVTHAGYVKQGVDFPREEFHTLIGAGGQTIRSIMGDTNTKINIPDVSNPNQNVIVVGEAANVARAVKQIESLLAKKAAARAAALAAADAAEEQDEDSDGGFNLK